MSLIRTVHEDNRFVLLNDASEDDDRSRRPQDPHLRQETLQGLLRKRVFVKEVRHKLDRGTLAGIQVRVVRGNARSSSEIVTEADRVGHVSKRSDVLSLTRKVPGILQ